MGFEAQLENIKNKQDLLAYVSSLPEDAEGILLVRLPQSDDEADYFDAKYIGPITLERAIYMVASYQHWVFSQIR